MKSLIIHNFYTSFTGEDLAVRESSGILKASGKVKVIEYYKYSKGLRKLSPVRKLITLLKANIPFYVPMDLKEILDKERPDIAQIHNLIPLINPWILKELRRRNIPVLYHIHNYRIFCPRGTCFLKDRHCMSCFSKSLASCLINNCLERPLYSLLYAYRVFLERLLLRYVDLFISPTNSAKEFYKRYLPEKNIIILKDYLEIPGELINSSEEKKEFIIFAGRLIREKGIFTALESANLLKGIKYKICGEGPELQLCKKIKERLDLKNVEFLGPVKREKLLRLIGEARILIFPSLWDEVYGRISREAIYLSTPVIASKRGANTELIQHNKTGFLFDPEETASLAELIERLWGDETLRKNAATDAYKQIGECNDSERYATGLLDVCKSLC